MGLSIADQQKLFKLTANRFQWDTQQVSGYVHGVKNGLDQDAPCSTYIQGFKKRSPYALGYIYGFIDAYGSDAFFTKWHWELELPIGEAHYYRWWEDALAATKTNSDLPG